MKIKNVSPIGSLHPILFFVLVYILALLFSIFIFSSLFYSLQDNDPELKTVKPLISSGYELH